MRDHIVINPIDRHSATPEASLRHNAAIARTLGAELVEQEGEGYAVQEGDCYYVNGVLSPKPRWESHPDLAWSHVPDFAGCGLVNDLMGRAFVIANAAGQKAETQLSGQARFLGVTTMAQRYVEVRFDTRSGPMAWNAPPASLFPVYEASVEELANVIVESIRRRL